MLRSKRRIAVATAAVAAVGFAAFIVPPAQAASAKNVVIWTDEERGPVMKKLLGSKSPVAGYKFTIKTYPSLTALDAAWASATAANGPDLVISNSAYASQGAADGKLMPLSIPSKVRAQFSPSSLKTLSYLGRVYGVPLDVDTTAMYYNKTLIKTPPKTFGAMVDYYKANKTSKALAGGLCTADGVWGSLPVLTALGGGAWEVKNGNPNPAKVLLNSAAIKANFPKYLLGADGKSNGFFRWENCADDFLAGKIPFMNSGGWRLNDVKTKLGTNWGLMPVPGLTASSKAGSPWVGYQGIYVTTFSASHGVSAGAMKFALQYMASANTQVRLSTLGNRPPANLAAAASIKNAALKGFAQAGGNGIPQVDTLLNNNASGSNWYDLLGDMYTKILVDGQPVGATLDKAAAAAKTNFEAATK